MKKYSLPVFYTAADFRQAIQQWKAAMKPQLVQAAKNTAAEILDDFAASVLSAEFESYPPQARKEVEQALLQTSTIARDLAGQLRRPTAT